MDNKWLNNSDNNKLFAKIYSINGARVMQQRVQNVLETINVGELKPGVYSVILENGYQRSKSKQIIVN